MPPEVYPVRQVTRYLRELIEANRHLSDIWVSGEVSNLTRASSGHVYFTLGDGGAALRCVLFRSRNVGQAQRIDEGLSVVVYGSLSLYEQRGDLSFIVDFVQPVDVLGQVGVGVVVPVLGPEPVEVRVVVRVGHRSPPV